MLGGLYNGVQNSTLTLLFMLCRSLMTVFSVHSLASQVGWRYASGTGDYLCQVTSTDLLATVPHPQSYRVGLHHCTRTPVP